MAFPKCTYFNWHDDHQANCSFVSEEEESTGYPIDN